MVNIVVWGGFGYTMGMDKITNEELARMINTGFQKVTEDIRGLQNDVGDLKKDMDIVKGEISHTNARLAMIERDVADIKRDIVSRNEFEDLMGRVKYLELKFGIQSGK